LTACIKNTTNITANTNATRHFENRDEQTRQKYVVIFFGTRQNSNRQPCQ